MVRLTGSWPGVGHVHQGPRGLGQGLVVDRVGDGGRLLLLGLPEVVVCEQHRGAVVCGDTAGTESRDREEGERGGRERRRGERGEGL